MTFEIDTKSIDVQNMSLRRFVKNLLDEDLDKEILQATIFFKKHKSHNDKRDTR